MSLYIPLLMGVNEYKRHIGDLDKSNSLSLSFFRDILMKRIFYTGIEILEF